MDVEKEQLDRTVPATLFPSISWVPKTRVAVDFFDFWPRFFPWRSSETGEESLE